MLNYIMPEQVFTLITSISTICFIFIWGITVICHLKYRRTRPDLAKRNKFKMPLYPFQIMWFSVFLRLSSLCSHWRRTPVFPYLSRRFGLSC
ncbi:hypothetical protein PO124_29590 [Bacillus licheniformis]|nr:hypothetical protein [Bacillus licheniformis]